MKSSKLPLTAAFLLLMSWVPAHAYVDPGTGSALIQGIIAAIAAVGVSAKLYWHRIVNFIQRKNDENSQRTQDGTSNKR